MVRRLSFSLLRGYIIRHPAFFAEFRIKRILSLASGTVFAIYSPSLLKTEYRFVWKESNLKKS